MTSVWIVNHYASDPRDSATGSRHFSLARRLCQLGWEPVLIAASSEHNSSRQRLDPGSPWGTDQSDGVLFRWIRTSVYHGNGPARLVNILQFTIAILLRRSTRDLTPPQIVIGSTVHPLAAWSASSLARRHHVPFIFEIRDLWPQTLIDMGKLRQNGIPARLMRRLERLLCTRAAGIITLLPHAADYLATIGVDPNKVTWISNGTDVADFQTHPSATGTVFTFQYFGSLGIANGLPAILHGFSDALRENPRIKCRLKLTGNGPERSNLVKLAAELGLSDLIEFAPGVPKEQIPTVAAQSDCLVVNLLDLKIYRYGISLNKLFDYMAAARPIVIAGNAVNNPVRDSDGGVCVPANDSAAIGEAMTRVLQADNAQREKWGRNAASYVAQHFDYSVLGDKLDEVLRMHLVKAAAGHSAPVSRRDQNPQ
ncbi:glycosyltransferase family 4 protein [Cryobacterium sp. Sr3]|uniref:glycosyltransferase family 4 protein n=1 Tax=Cryobacterium sp. Sr3 TaxID=1259194 RepID=UPI00106C1A41|nr:glycosyltransferase family 4 protein [Cryobacterium sp. Sr3]TFB55266.1 glycosyltransferase WbuB [Cryobacterium sp. Sr3]